MSKRQKIVADTATHVQWKVEKQNPPEPLMFNHECQLTQDASSACVYVSEQGEVIDIDHPHVIIVHYYSVKHGKRSFAPAMCIGFRVSHVCAFPDLIVKICMPDECTKQIVRFDDLFYPSTFKMKRTTFVANLLHFDFEAALMLMPHHFETLHRIRNHLLQLPKNNLRRVPNSSDQLHFGDFVAFYYVQSHLLFTTSIGNFIWTNKLMIHLTHGFCINDIQTMLDCICCVQSATNGQCFYCKTSTDIVFVIDERCVCSVCVTLLRAILEVGIEIAKFRHFELTQENINKFNNFLKPKDPNDFD